MLWVSAAHRRSEVPLASPIDPYSLVGTTLRERYTIVSFAGVGRHSIVYRAIEAETQHAVALRFLSVRSNLTPSQRTVTVERLRALVQPMIEIAEHYRSLADVIEVGALVTSEGRWMPAIVQPWLNGQTLEAVLLNERRSGDPTRTLGRAIELLSPVADALQYAHIRGMVHGSVAPRNVFVRGTRASRASFDDVHRRAPEDWAEVDLLDLGIAQTLAMLQARDHAFAESADPLYFFAPAHGAPEQFGATNAVITPAADVFALALIMVELVTGKAPLGEGDEEQLERAARDPVYRPTPRASGVALGPYVEAVFERALAVRPDDRYATMASFWDALRVASRVMLRGSSHSIVPPPLPAGPPALPEAFAMRSVAGPQAPPREYARALALRDYTSRDRSIRDSDAPPEPVPSPPASDAFYSVAEHDLDSDEPASAISVEELSSLADETSIDTDGGRSVAPTAMDSPPPTPSQIFAEMRGGARIVSAMALAASFIVGVSAATIGERALAPKRATLTYSPLPDDVLAAIAKIRLPPPPAAPVVSGVDATTKPAAVPCKKGRGKKAKTCVDEKTGAK